MCLGMSFHVSRPDRLQACRAAMERVLLALGIVCAAWAGAHAACLANGVDCTGQLPLSNTCCTGYCYHIGGVDRCCDRDGAPCTSSDECCSGTCDSAIGKCAR